MLPLTIHAQEAPYQAKRQKLLRGALGVGGVEGKAGEGAKPSTTQREGRHKAQSRDAAELEGLTALGGANGFAQRTKGILRNTTLAMFLPTFWGTNRKALTPRSERNGPPPPPKALRHLAPARAAVNPPIEEATNNAHGAQGHRAAPATHGLGVCIGAQLAPRAFAGRPVARVTPRLGPRLLEGLCRRWSTSALLLADLVVEPPERRSGSLGALRRGAS